MNIFPPTDEASYYPRRFYLISFLIEINSMMYNCTDVRMQIGLSSPFLREL